MYCNAFHINRLINLILKVVEYFLPLFDLADVIIFVVNCKDGLTDLDKDIATILRKVRKSIVLCINKVDDFKKQEADTFEFYELGFDNVFPVSSVNKSGVGDMQIIEYYSKSKAYILDSSRLNLKITVQDDLNIVKYLL